MLTIIKTVNRFL